MSALSSLFGTPPRHAEEKADEKAVAVTAPEFDITQYVKKLGVSIGVLAGAAAAALKLFEVKQITPGIVAAALGLTAICLLGVCFVAAVDIAARAYVTRGQPASDTDSKSDAADSKSAAADAKPDAADSKPDTVAAKAPALSLGAVTRRMLVWLEGESEPRLVLAVAGDGEASKFLLSGTTIGDRDQGDSSVKSLEGSPSWHDAKEVRAVKATGWP